jgi:polyisoprenoid-binding protein YceI
MLISKVRGKFNKLGAEIVLDDEDLTRSKVDITIDAAGIDTGIADRDSHLRSPDFLDAAKHPAIRYVGRRVEKRSGGATRSSAISRSAA